jgi:hypothetical protein
MDAIEVKIKPHWLRRCGAPVYDRHRIEIQIDLPRKDKPRSTGER